MRWLFALILATTCLGTPVAARDLFVNNQTGDDGWDGRFPQSSAAATGPVRTINRALQLAEKGDRVVLAKTDQPYRESICLIGTRHGGITARPFVLEGNGAILDGSAPIPAQAWEPYRIDVFRFRPRRLAYQQLFLDGGPLVRRYLAAEGARLPDLKPLEWCLHEGFLYFRVEGNKGIGDYGLSCAELKTGVTLYQVENCLVRDLVVQGFQLDGVNAHDSAFACVLQRLTCRGNGRTGITVAGASRVTIDNCLSGLNGYAQLLTDGYSHTRLNGGEFDMETAPPLIRRGGEIVGTAKGIEPPAEQPRP